MRFDLNEKTSKRLLFISAALLLLFIFLCNFLTPMCVDDFTYLKNFETKEFIKSPFEVFESMSAHAEKMNGRLMSHGTLQVMMFLPSAVFDIINSAVFVGVIFLICHISFGIGHKYSLFDTLLFSAVFGAVWIYVPAFGEVVFWQTGAVNYLWFLLFGFLFLLPFISYYRSGKTTEKLYLKILFVIYGFYVGAYLENGSAAVIGMATLFILSSWLIEKRKPLPYQIFSVISAVLGYFFMLSAPAELKNKGGDAFSLDALLENFDTALDKYLEFSPLLTVFAVLFISAVILKCKRCAIISSFIFLLGSIAANFILIFASYYPERCSSSVAVFLITADAILIYGLSKKKNFAKYALCILLSLTVIFAAYHVMIGAKDVISTGREMIRVENEIKAAADNGDTEYTVYMLYPETKYSAVKNLKYIDIESPDTWPNHDMAKHFGLKKIYGEP